MKSARRNRSPSRKLAVETLENRCLLAVSAFLPSGGNLLNIVGDDADDQIRLTRQETTGEAHIEGLGGTTINGLAEVSFSGIRNVDIDLGDGDDCLIAEVSGLYHSDYYYHPLTTIDTGNGQDVIDVRVTSELMSPRLGMVRINVVAGDGDDHVILNSLSLTVAPEAVIIAGAGSDRVELRGDLHLCGSVYDAWVELGDGDDVLQGDPDPSASFTGQPWFFGGEGYDRLFEPGYFVDGFVDFYDPFEAQIDCPDSGCVVPGDVSAEIDPERADVLVLTGDVLDNDIRLVRSGWGTVLVESGGTGTTINGTTDPAEFTGIKRVEADLGSGDDAVAVDHLMLCKGLHIDMGYGGDTVDVQGGIYRSVVIHASGGSDAVTVQSALVLCKTTIDTAWDNDTVALSDSVFGRLMINTDDGEDAVTLDRLFILDKTRIDLGEDDDTLTVTDSIFGDDALADGGLGDDLLTLPGDNLFLAGRKAKGFETVIQ